MPKESDQVQAADTSQRLTETLERIVRNQAEMLGGLLEGQKKMTVQVVGPAKPEEQTEEFKTAVRGQRAINRAVEGDGKYEWAAKYKL